jgi:proline utilization trans-activator
VIATYGYMDGEHAFSAAIVLVMVNVAFPFDSRDRDAMELALDVLKGMADKGNGHIRARREYLINLRSMVEEAPKSRPTPPVTSNTGSPGPYSVDPFVTSGPSSFGPAGEEFINAPFTSLEATAAFSQPIFGLPTTEDANLWEEVYGNIDVGMDFDWTEAARMRNR